LLWIRPPLLLKKNPGDVILEKRHRLRLHGRQSMLYTIHLNENT